MSYKKETEAMIENKLISHLQELGYKYVKISNEKELSSNLKTQLEKHNSVRLQKAGVTELSDSEFKKVLNYLKGGSIIQKAKKLRNSTTIELENGNNVRITFLNMENKKWCQNEFQVSSQISMTGNKKNRYDVTILMNGIPVTQIELKRKGISEKEAFHQFKRYQQDSFGAGFELFNYLQILISSNSTNTKYYSNNTFDKLSLKQRFTWTDEKNNKINELSAFTEAFLNPCTLSRTIVENIVVNKSKNILMILRPYQHYAYKAIIDKVNNTNLAQMDKDLSKTTFQNGYVWHSTGSGKTLTSFITSKNLRFNPNIHKICFVVDRKDLDTQTQDEFNSFEKGSVDNTNNTTHLYSKLKSSKKGDKLIITTIQKLDRVLKNEDHIKGLTDSGTNNKKIIFIFDECHRSQFGKTHKSIKTFFKQHQMFGFTGTPIFKENSNKSLIINNTTAELFGERLHTYNIKNAIADNNVLRFSMEYYNTISKKTYSYEDMDEEASIKEELNTVEKKLLEDNKRITNISDFILSDIKKKTHNLKYNAIFATSNIPVALKYYKDMQSKNKDLKIGIIFSIGNQNQDNKDFSTEQNIDIDSSYQNSNTELQKAADEYSKTFGVNTFDFNSKDGFENYRKDISRRMKKKDVSGDHLDLLIVVDMFLTGFDSEFINTLYVDKFMKYHLLLQAFSRTNRLSGSDKTQGNIVCFRNIVKNVNDSIAMFSKEPNEEETADFSIIMEGFNKYIKNVNDEVIKLRDIAATPQAVDKLEKESDKLAFVNIMKELNKNIVKATQFHEYEDVFIDMAMPEEFIEYKGKYLDIYDEIKDLEEKEELEDENSLLEIDFELDLFQTDLINVDYIYKLLENYINEDIENSKKNEEKFTKQISTTIDSEQSLRGIKEPIMKYVKEKKEKKEKFDFDELKSYINIYMGLEVSKFCEKEDIDETKFNKLFEDYIYFNGNIGNGSNINEIFKKYIHPYKKIEKRKLVINFLKQLKDKYGKHI